MSKNKNRSKFDQEINSRCYTIKQKRELYNYCYICSKRSGCFYVDCSPQDMRSRGRHGNGKAIYSYKFRAYKTWKYNRKTQYKEKLL